jgi:hypothetical protein
LQAAHNLEAVHTGHAQVEDDGLSGTGPDHRKSLGPVARFQRHVPKVRDSRSQRIAHGGIVVDD